MNENLKSNKIETGREYVLWDGDCGFCRRSAEKMSQLDQQKSFLFAPYQSFSETELGKVGLDYRQCARELQIISNSGKTFGGAFGINYFFWRQPRWKFLPILGGLFPLLMLVEVLLYKLVATNRMLFSKILFLKKG